MDLDKIRIALELEAQTMKPVTILEGYKLSTPAQLPKLRYLDRFMENHSGYIAGGCFKNLFLGEPIKDIDVFFHTDDDFKSAVEYFDDSDEFEPMWRREDESLVTYKCSVTGNLIQLIGTFVGNPAEVVTSFDFTITKAFYCKDEETGEYQFYHHDRFFEHLMNKKLVVDDKIKFPVSTFNRSFRYTRYGYGLCGESKSKLIESLQGVGPVTFTDLYFGID